MRVTINDVAKLAAVHPGTVSRVLNKHGEAARVSEETRKRILKAAENLRFYPDHSAQSLARSATNILGVYVYPHGPAGPTIGEYQAQIINGIEKQAYLNGYDLILMGLSVPEEDIERCKRQLYQRRVDGLIILGSTERPDAIRALSASGKPVVGIDSYGDDIGTLSINIDNFNASISATKHLVSLGHRKIGFIGSPYDPELREESLRRKGYIHALEAAGIRCDFNLIMNGSNSLAQVKIGDGWCMEGGKVGIRTLLKRDPEVTAVFCMNDQVAAGAIYSLYEQGVKVPDQFSVIGFDDSMIARYTYPPLTTVRHDLEEMGQQAVTHLINAIDNKQVLTQTEIHYVGAELAIRESTGPVKVK
jgi:LacI family transcriptional regulator